MLWKNVLLALMASNAYAFNDTEAPSTGADSTQPAGTQATATNPATTDPAGTQPGGNSPTTQPNVPGGNPTTQPNVPGGNPTTQPMVPGGNPTTGTPGGNGTQNGQVVVAYTVKGSAAMTMTGLGNYTDNAAIIADPAVRTFFKDAIVAALGNGIVASDITIISVTVVDARRLEEKSRRLTGSKSVTVDYVIKVATEAKATTIQALDSDGSLLKNALNAQLAAASGNLAGASVTAVTDTKSAPPATLASSGWTWTVSKHVGSLVCAATSPTVLTGSLSTTCKELTANADYVTVTHCGEGAIKAMLDSTETACNSATSATLANGACGVATNNLDSYKFECEPTGSTSSAAAVGVSASLMAAIAFFW